MRHIAILFTVVSFLGCASQDKRASKPTEFQKKNPVVTIETSGDLYYEENGNNIQMDLFGNCSPGQERVYIEIEKTRSVAPCQGGRYRYSLNLPPSFFGSNSKARNPSSKKYVMKELSVFHYGHKKLKATSYILIDVRKKEVRSVINKQTKFDRLPTGDHIPVTQYNAFGSCSRDSVVKIDIITPNRYGHKQSKYDETKKCEDAGSYYFLSQIDGFPKKGTQFKVYVDKRIKVRRPASVSGKEKYRYKNLLNWKVPID